MKFINRINSIENLSSINNQIMLIEKAKDKAKDEINFSNLTGKKIKDLIKLRETAPSKLYPLIDYVQNQKIESIGDL